METVQIGGDDWPPLMAKFYLGAARIVLDSNELILADRALPILYLQRHCLELIIKDVILACFHLDEARSIVGKHRTGIEPPKFDHDLPKLVETAHRCLNKLGFDADRELTGLRGLAQSLANLENGSPERFRYAYVKRFENGVAPPPGFPNSLTIPISELQERLTVAFSECVDIDNDSSLYRRIYGAAGAEVEPVLPELLGSLIRDGSDE